MSQLQCSQPLGISLPRGLHTKLCTLPYALTRGHPSILQRPASGIGSSPALPSSRREVKVTAAAAAAGAAAAAASVGTVLKATAVQPLVQEGILLWTLLAVCGITGQLAEARTKLGGWLGAPLISMLLAVSLAASGVLPVDCKSYDVVWRFIMPLAASCFLLETNVGRLFTEGGPTLIAFLVGAVGMVLGAWAGWLLLGPALGAEGWRTLACLCASYVGGSVNFAAVAEAVQLPASAVPAAMAADNLAMAVFLAMLMAVPVQQGAARVLARYTRADAAAVAASVAAGSKGAPRAVSTDTPTDAPAAVKEAPAPAPTHASTSVVVTPAGSQASGANGSASGSDNKAIVAASVAAAAAGAANPAAVNVLELPVVVFRFDEQPKQAMAEASLQHTGSSNGTGAAGGDGHAVTIGSGNGASLIPADCANASTSAAATVSMPAKVLTEVAAEPAAAINQSIKLAVAASADATAAFAPAPASTRAVRAAVVELPPILYSFEEEAATGSSLASSNGNGHSRHSASNGNGTGKRSGDGHSGVIAIDTAAELVHDHSLDIRLEAASMDTEVHDAADDRVASLPANQQAVAVDSDATSTDSAQMHAAATVAVIAAPAEEEAAAVAMAVGIEASTTGTEVNAAFSVVSPPADEQALAAAATAHENVHGLPVASHSVIDGSQASGSMSGDSAAAVALLSSTASGTELPVDAYSFGSTEEATEGVINNYTLSTPLAGTSTDAPYHASSSISSSSAGSMASSSGNGNGNDHSSMTLTDSTGVSSGTGEAADAPIGTASPLASSTSETEVQAAAAAVAHPSSEEQAEVATPAAPLAQDSGASISQTSGHATDDDTAAVTPLNSTATAVLELPVVMYSFDSQDEKAADGDSRSASTPLADTDATDSTNATASIVPSNSTSSSNGSGNGVAKGSAAVPEAPVAAIAPLVVEAEMAVPEAAVHTAEAASTVLAAAPSLLAPTVVELPVLMYRFEVSIAKAAEPAALAAASASASASATSPTAASSHTTAQEHMQHAAADIPLHTTAQQSPQPPAAAAPAAAPAAPVVAIAAAVHASTTAVAGFIRPAEELPAQLYKFDQRTGLVTVFAAGPGDDSSSSPSSSGSANTGSITPTSLVCTLLAATVCAIASRHIALTMIQAPAFTMLVNAALATTLAALGGVLAGKGSAGPFSGAATLGSSLMGIFFAVIGASAGSLSSLATCGPLLAFMGVMVAVHWVFTWLVGLKLLRLPLPAVLLASNANIGGPATAAGMAVSKGWVALVQPAMLAGSIGYAIGTAAGLAVAKLLAP